MALLILLYLGQCLSVDEPSCFLTMFWVRVLPPVAVDGDCLPLGAEWRTAAILLLQAAVKGEGDRKWSAWRRLSGDVGAQGGIYQLDVWVEGSHFPGKWQRRILTANQLWGFLLLFCFFLAQRPQEHLRQYGIGNPAITLEDRSWAGTCQRLQLYKCPLMSPDTTLRGTAVTNGIVSLLLLGAIWISASAASEL